MKRLEENELQNINGGFASIIVNYATNAVKFIYELGQSLGSSIRRIAKKNYCSL